ncbi:MAG: DUF3500 domain-containing protein [Planctomycetota bacterium]
MPCAWKTSVLILLAASYSAGDARAVEPLSTRMANAAIAFLESLSPKQRALAQMDYADQRRSDWHWIPKPTRKGLILRDMDPKQRELAHALLKTGLSDVGYEKARIILTLESVLHILEKDRMFVRDPDKYYVTIFGSPSDSGNWGWSFEGHHLSVNYTLSGGKVVASTPTFFGANPRWMPVDLKVGPKKETRTLDKEERLAFELLQSLTPDQRKIAYRTEIPNKLLVSGPPTELYRGEPVGLSADKMTPAQVKILREILQVYANNVTKEAAEARLGEIEQSGIDGIHYAWFGADRLDGDHFFRIQGPTFTIELDNTQADPVGTPSNHIHSLWRHRKNDFGASSN